MDPVYYRVIVAILVAYLVSVRILPTYVKNKTVSNIIRVVLFFLFAAWILESFLDTVAR